MESIEKRIRTAVSPFVPDVVANNYTGDKLTYVVFNYDETGTLYANSTAGIVMCSVQVHLFLPLNTNPRTLKRSIRQALARIGTFPTVVNASDSDSQHYVFEFDAMETV